MMQARILRLALLMVAIAAAPAGAVQVRGTIVDADGKPLAGVMVTVSPSAPVVGALSTSVFTGADGRYQLSDPNKDETALTLAASLLGYAPVELTPLGQLGVMQDTVRRADFTLARTDNVAGQVPASAWMQGFPDDGDSRHALWICAGCHQLPAPKMQRYAAFTRQTPLAGREMAWHAMIQYMRVKTFDLGPQGSAWPDFPYEVKADPSIAGYDLEDEQIIARALAAHLPTDYSTLKSYDPGAPLGVTPGTVIREYQMPPDGFTREVGLSARSPYAWGADLTHNQLVRLDPATSAIKYFKVPFDKASGPHTIVDDPQGNLWVTSIENDLLMRLDPQSEKWTLYQDFGAGALIHDLALDSNFQVAYDHKGRVWATLIGLNKVGGLNPETRETVQFQAPQPEGKGAIHTAIYGIVMNSAKTHLWYAQLGGGVGSFNVETLKFETHIPFEMGEGPRRLAIDEDDRIYVPLMGSSEVFIYDTRAKKELARVKLPDRWAATYNVTWDPWRKCLWVGTTNADVIYRMDPQTYAFTRYPLPRAGAFLRMITFDRHTGNLWTAYSATGEGPQALVEIDPGDGVRPAGPKIAFTGLP
ncbi:MAG: carboxypeptidase regulatory-like domain-containing protein [Gammaproteobacteria bacterium]